MIFLSCFLFVMKMLLLLQSLEIFKILLNAQIIFFKILHNSLNLFNEFQIEKGLFNPCAQKMSVVFAINLPNSENI